MTTATKTTSRLEERFRLWDVDGNGVIERSDLAAEADGIISRLGAEGTPRGDALKAAYLGMFDRLAAAAGTDRMDRDQFMEVAGREMVGSEDGFAEVARPTLQATMDVLDTDGDGEISRSEMRRWLDAVGVSARDSDRVFDELDTDGSGTLSASELVDAVRDYHLGRNDIPLLGG
ncbi:MULTISPECIES: EF-hand domain-containing protein [Nocardiopsis]|uniref:Signal transduction protein with EFhand domain n=1 Tax=Nocardiopsis dassonvillei (strain ATCC 23218 / DSM 43111 / CIP 107115 / JCM 7437 / KCTC 9190 / NBRC 14626 / NCTC 10488 / NRRL B-5397 / IMRU 509) TaxID=446468 RepID=D7B3F4_NOCDD|nr:EF-hand domain-containing protein [Nocardiopsis dassonvillei]ADH66882.1 putative signal transduction protein with EFhand domain [Nocardiopsis dassonvillei subsp. dassonvillei DSM 43111]APC35150.1 signal transduction protein [Nocardiopsis dassonvillei]NKY80865.1 EF-hand domain-containing protein [Nocardiopsis dassonvillei]VEI86606.1 Calcium-binding protein [Nocardiopsis dassonvillei]